jgi:hypothetical protein
MHNYAVPRRSTLALDDMSYASAMAKVASDIERFGWHCLSVAPRLGEEGTPFSYTIGLSETLQHPEIAIFGLGSETAHAIFYDCVETIRSGTIFPLNEAVSDVVGGGYLVQFRRVRADCLPEYFGTAARHYGKTKLEVVVMFWPDKDRLFPWESSGANIQREALDLV